MDISSQKKIIIICSSSKVSTKCPTEAETKYYESKTSSPKTSSLSKSSFFLDYPMKRQIGKGAFGTIYHVLGSQDQVDYAAKVICPSKSSLEKEYMILKTLQNKIGFPQVKEFIRSKAEEVLVMSLLGPNLQELMIKCGGHFSLKTILMIGLQCIQRLDVLHESGYLHRDIKPENFVLGYDGNSQQIVHLIDFGLSTSYLDEFKNHIPFCKKSKISGTLYYLTVFGHIGIEASRRDDLISLGFMLVHLFNGKLPWAEIIEGDKDEKITAIYKMKATLPVEKLCMKLPEEFVEYFNYLLTLPFFKKPDYNYLGGLFVKMMKNKGILYDFDYDWNKRKQSGIDLNGRKISCVSLNSYKKIVDEPEISL